MAIATAEAAGLGTQAWSGVGEPGPARVPNQEWPARPSPKPDKQFFTSTWNFSTSSCSWLERQRIWHRNPSGGGRLPRPGERLWLLDPVPTTLIFVIDTLDDFKELAARYPHRRKDNPRDPTLAPNWRHISESAQFSGVHATENAIEAVAAQLPADQPRFSGWDVESTLWLRWSLTNQRCHGRVVGVWTVEGV